MKKKSITKAVRHTHKVLPRKEPSRIPAPRAAGSAGSWNKSNEKRVADKIIKKLVEGPVPPELVAAVDKLDKIPELFETENTRPKYMLIEVEGSVENPGRVLLDALPGAGIPWIKVIYTDLSYIKKKVDSL